MLTAANL